jgi:tol-pal system protein YbgF
MSIAHRSPSFAASNPASGVPGATCASHRPWRLCLLALAFVGSGLGCATAPAARTDAESARAVERLRAENASQVRKVEELENQVFILNAELDNRRGAGPAAVAPPPVQLPEVKLARGEKVPAPDSGGGPASLVDETEIEYAGAAAERSSGKRPVLKLYGSGSDPGDTTAAETSLIEGGSTASETASSDDRDGSRADDGGAARPIRERHRSALSRRPPHPSPSAKPARMASDGTDPAPARNLGTLALAPTTMTAPAPAPALAPAPTARVGRSVAAPARDNAPADNALYQNALGQLRAGHHDEAVAGLRAFVAAHPQHDLADNAQYWLGECFYDRKDFSTALREFRRVVEAFPTGNKVPDALLKLGLSYLAIGSARPGREALTDLVRRFPQHPTAALAQARLAELPKEVR